MPFDFVTFYHQLFARILKKLSKMKVIMKLKKRVMKKMVIIKHGVGKDLKFLVKFER